MVLEQVNKKADKTALEGKADKNYVDNAIDNAVTNISIDVDTELSETSVNPVQNRVVTKEMKKIARTFRITEDSGFLEYMAALGNSGFSGIESNSAIRAFVGKDQADAYIDTVVVVSDSEMGIEFNIRDKRYRWVFNLTSGAFVKEEEISATVTEPGGEENSDGVLRIYASNLFNTITEEMLIPEGEELPEEDLAFVNTILSTNAKTYNKIIEHYNLLSTLSPIGIPNVIIDYSLIDGFNSGVFASTPASIVIANVNKELTVSIVPQNEYKSLTSTSGGNFPFLSGWNLNSNGDVKRLEIGTLFVNLADNTLINDGIAAEINNYTKTAIQNGYIDVNMVKLVYPNDMGILEELLAAGASTNAMIAEYGSYFLTSQPIAISYDESLSRNRLFALGIDGGIITIDIS